MGKLCALRDVAGLGSARSFRKQLLPGVLLVAVLGGACSDQPGGARPATPPGSALTAAQCDYFEVDGKTRICHATGSARNPFVVLNVAEAACVSAHSAHPRDYVAVNDPTCGGNGCLPANAPCDPTLPCCSGLTCRAGSCQPTDLCAGVTCSADQCHVASCDPATGHCIDEPKTQGFPCTDDGNPCTVDACDGAGACSHAPGNPGAVCRPANGPCDVAESCDGVSNDCPADQFLAACTGTGESTTAAITPESGGTITLEGLTLTAGAGAVESSQTITVTSTTESLPSDLFAYAPIFEFAPDRLTFVQPVVVSFVIGTAAVNPTILWSRPEGGYDDLGGTYANGVIATTITHFSKGGVAKSNCVNQPDGASCSDGNPCTLNDVCSGQRCIPGAPLLCTALDECHAAGTCDSKTGLCSNPPQASGTTCSDDGNPCTIDACDGLGGCIHPAGNAGAACRASAGACDPAESCDGVNSNCPADAKSTAVCRSSAGPCDAAEACDGVSNDCPPDQFLLSGVECRPAAGGCDIAESCTGTSAACPADAKSVSTCRPSAGPCDVAESCDGISNDCPADQFLTLNTDCRPAAGDCDVAESCSGASAACPADVKSTAVCRASQGACDLAESCDGVNDSCPTDVKSTAVCRASQGACDLAESCNGVNDDCPADAKAASCSVTYSCSCVGTTCGNGAVTGAHQQVVTAIPPQTVVDSYRPSWTDPRASGWACLVEGANVCTCEASAPDECGNGAMTGAIGDTASGVITADAIASYGAGRIGSEATGWACIPSRADSGADIGYACECVDASCGSSDTAIATGAHGELVLGIPPLDVVNHFGPSRVGSRATGWACMPMSTDIVECVATSAGITCGNGGPAGFIADQVSGISAGTAIGTYRVLRRGTEVSGWAATPVSYGIDNCAGTTCVALDQCHVPGTCGDPATGLCSSPAKRDGTWCDDGNPSTINDQCQAGVCAGTDLCAGVTCVALSQCHLVGSCDPMTGQCSNPAKNDGVTCDDGNLCTQDDQCQGGACQGNATTCVAFDQCHVAGICNPGTGVCSNPAKNDGVTCDDGNLCTQNDYCQGGACQGGPPLNCDDGNVCTVETCDPVIGCQHPALNCDDGNVCTVETCDPVIGCQHPALNCDDGNACTADSCNPASGCQHPPVNCDDADPCTTDSCNPITGCDHSPLCPSNAMFLSGSINFNPHITNATCVSGFCNGSCDTGFQDCNGTKQSDGCETNLNTSDANCGGCGNLCTGGTHCSGGTCLAPDSTPPTVAIQNVRNNGVVRSGFVVGTMSDDVGVTSVEVSLDGGGHQAATLTGASTWKFQLPTGASTWRDGSQHTIAVRARDAANNTGTAGPITVRKGVNKDVNGDGYADVVTSGLGLNGAGAVLVFHSAGSNGLGATQALAASAASNIISAETTSTNFGMSLALGDLNGDGYADVVVAAAAYSSFQGRVYIFHSAGSSGLSGTQAIAATDAHNILTGGAGFDTFGNSVAVGDVNGDGYSDLAIGAPGVSSYKGAVYIFHSTGPGGLGNAQTVSPSAAHNIVSGDTNSTNLGNFVTLGDVNGDNYADLATAAPSYNSSTGRVYVFHSSGSNGLGAAQAVAPAGAHNIIDGAVSQDVFGRSIAVGDVNGDGYGDLAVSAPGASSFAGRMYVFHSTGTNGLSATQSIATTAAHNIVTESQGSAGMGNAVAIEDLNGDGYGDVVVADYQYSVVYLDGRVLVFHSTGANGLGTTQAMSVNSAHNLLNAESFFNYFGFSISIADVNGDGFPDLLVGAQRAASDGGRVYVFHSAGSSGLGGTQGIAALSAHNYITGTTSAFLGSGLASLAPGRSGAAPFRAGEPFARCLGRQ